VLCEKPLADSSKDAEQMVQACREADVRLMTAYRLHFEEGNLQAIEYAHDGTIGTPRLFDSIHTMQVAPDNIRIDRSLGEGPVEDIGVYCISAARYIFKSEPEEVFAFAVKSDDPRFAEVPEAVSVSMRFSEARLGTLLCGFGQMNASEYRVIGTEGTLELDPAFTWQGDIVMTIKIQGKEKKKTYKHRDQIAAEILYFAECIQTGREPETSGEEGLIDVRIIESIRESYSQGKPVRIEAPSKRVRPDSSQSIKRKPHAGVTPVHAAPPSNK
jgi:glucose-fructose oxidoreductase